MNKTLAITTIALIAVVMGMSAIAPALAYQAEADNHGGKHQATPDKCDILGKLLAEGKITKAAFSKVCGKVGPGPGK